MFILGHDDCYQTLGGAIVGATMYFNGEYENPSLRVETERLNKDTIVVKAFLEDMEVERVTITKR